VILDAASKLNYKCRKTLRAFDGRSGAALTNDHQTKPCDICVDSGLLDRKRAPCHARATRLGSVTARHVGGGDVINQDRGPMSFSRWMRYMDLCPWSAPRQARRRDGIPARFAL
jgi:hypothetical protein